MTTLYLDVTQTYVSRLATGIQRVVRKVTEELLRQQVGSIDRVRPVVALGDKFLLLDDLGVDELLGDPSKAHVPSTGPIGRMMARGGAHLPMLMDILQRRRFAQAAAAAIDRPLPQADFATGDIVLLLDAFWGGSQALAAARTARLRGATVIATIYDLIPVTHPSYMPPVAAKLFKRRLRLALKICDGFVAISKTTAAELHEFAGADRANTEVAYCGADIVPQSAPCPPLPEGALASRGAEFRGFSYISVSTLEPRKGHQTILDAFERLWAQGSTARLTFVGRRGWDVEPLWNRCRELEARTPLFRLEEGADDARLAELMACSSLAIVASKAEGFGLPVVEALMRDLPVLASDIPVFREIGGDAVAFFAEGDAIALAERISDFENDPEPMRAAALSFAWPTWREAAPSYAQAALRLHARVGLSAKEEQCA